MIELIQITNDPTFAARCDRLAGMRVFIDLERHGKAERQAGRNTFLSDHVLEDIGRVHAALRHSPLMVRVNPLHPGTAGEVQAVIDQGCELLMLPMFEDAATLAEFSRIVDRRRPIVGLLETAGALRSLPEWVGTPGLEEVYVGLNDLHVSLGQHFMFESLGTGDLDRVANLAGAAGLRWGFGGIARLDEGLLPGRAVLGEHLRLGSSAVILSRTFHREGAIGCFEDQVQTLRDAERTLAARSPQQVADDARATRAVIARIAGTLGV